MQTYFTCKLQLLAEWVDTVEVTKVRFVDYMILNQLTYGDSVLHNKSYKLHNHREKESLWRKLSIQLKHVQNYLL